jgi:uncharacterized membrane protein YeiB
MLELTQIIADSIFLIFQIFEYLFSELDTIIIFDLSLFDWVITLFISYQLINLILQLFGYGLEVFKEIRDGTLYDD